MTFYIPPFLFGVISTVAAEFVSLVVASIAIAARDKKRKGEKDVKEEADSLVGTYDENGQWKESAEELRR